MRRKLTPFVKCTIAGLILTVMVILVNLWQEYSVIHRICDGLFVAGALLLCVGGLKFARNGGTFDMMAYGLKSAFYTSMPWARPRSPLENRKEDFAEYQARKMEKRTPAKGLVLAGITYIAASALTFVIYLLVG